MKNRFYSHSATHHTTLLCAAWREEEVPSSHTEPPPATLSEAGQQEATTSAASEEEEEEEEEGNVTSVHCTASLWRRGTSIPHGYVCSTVLPHSAPSSRLLTPQEMNTENRIMRYQKKKEKKVKNEAGERCENGKNACSFYRIQSSLQRRQGEGRETQAGRGAKRATTKSPQRTQTTTTQQHLFPRRAWNFERDAVSKWEKGHV